MSFFRKIDMFGLPISMKIRGHSRLTSSMGGLLTIVLYIILISILTLLTYTAIYFKIGSIISYTEYNEIPSVQNLSIGQGKGKDINFVFAVLDKTLNPIELNSSFLTFNFSMISYVYSNITNKLLYLQKNYTPNKCDSIIIKDLNLPEKDSNKYICFNYTEYDQIKFAGDIIKFREFYEPKFYIGPNIDLIDKINYTNDYINNNLGGVVMSFSYVIPQVVNLTVPYKSIQRIIKFKFGESIDISLMNIYYKSYESLIPKLNPIENKFVSLDKLSYHKNLDNKIELNILLSDNNQNILRTYDTIDLYLAKFLAGFEALFFIFSHIDKYFTRNYLKLYLMNKFFRFDDNTNDPSIELSSKRIIIDNVPINEESNFSADSKRIIESLRKSIDEKSENISLKEKENYFRRIDEYFNSISGKKIRLNFNRLVCFNKNDNKYEIFEKYSKVADNYLNFDYLIKVMNDMNKLKTLLMTPEQIKIFEFYYTNNYFIEYPEIVPKEINLSILNFIKLFNKSESYMINYFNDKLLKSLNLEIDSYQIKK